MSKVGKKPITIPDGVKVGVSGGEIEVEGPAGKLKREFPAKLKVEVIDDKVAVSSVGSSRRALQLWGLTRSLIQNMVAGVKKPFRKELELTGIGYRVEKKADGLSLSLGFSHPVEFKAPEGIELEVIDKAKIVVSGADKQLVGQVAAQIRSLKPPEPYKGKGFKYADEVVRKKPGKAGKAGATLGAESK